MPPKSADRYRLRIADAPAPRTAPHINRHAAITRELGTFVKYQDWADKLRESWAAADGSSGPTR